MRKTCLGAALSALIIAPTAAMAQDGSGVYAGIAGGANFLTDSDFDVLGTVDVDNEYDLGFAVSGAVGYDFGKVWELGGFRTELELSYRENSIDTHNVAALGGDQPGSKGDASSLALMVNALHDFDTGSPVTPYLGGGIGYAWNDLDNYGIDAVPDVLNDDDSGFAWQLIAGVGYDLSPQATISVDYRYFSTSADVTSSAATGGTSSDVDLDSHTVMFGLRYRF